MTSTLTIPTLGPADLVTRVTGRQELAPRRRVLVSAYAVSPARGSEPGMGWNICTRLARHHDVTVLCSPQVPPNAQDFRGEIESHLGTHGPIPGLTFHFVDPPPLSYFTQRETPLMRRTLYYAGYRSWQRAAFHAARALHSAKPFDVAHQLNITGFREPGYLWKLPGVPFVWGPVGGAANVPPAFLPLMGWRERMFHRMRNVTNAIQKRTKRRCVRTARRASHIWVVGEANRHMVEDVWGCRAEEMLEVGGDAAHPLGRPRTFDGVNGSRTLRIVWSGQHIGRKALPLLLRAMATVNGVELTVLGDGPESAAWKTLAAQLNLAKSVTWTGRVPRDVAIRHMADADAFVSTSVLEETSLVVLEALSLGLPVVCHDACGMGVAVTDACGVKVPMRTRPESIAGFAAALRTLAAGGERFASFSRGALARAQELSWDGKASEIAATYENVCQSSAGCGTR